jgi:hypothetical protein
VREFANRRALTRQAFECVIFPLTITSIIRKIRLCVNANGIISFYKFPFASMADDRGAAPSDVFGFSGKRLIAPAAEFSTWV